ncbi:MAG: hypothetical protein JW846_02050 [Dehalococcoidia bacterium]|nr:hypothetical protein [Dehalococcoidia bacterium]
MWFSSLLNSAFSLVRQFLRPYLIINILYYSLVGVSMAYVTFHPEIQDMLTSAVLASFTQGPLSIVAEAYASGAILKSMALTFGVNFAIASVLVIFLPSLIIPFSGVAIGLFRAVLWGLLLAPTTPELQAAMIPHSLTLLVEGQAYILAMLGAWILGCAFVSPKSVGALTWREGYAQGVRNGASIYLLVAIVLAIAAVYEVLEVIYLVPLLIS